MVEDRLVVETRLQWLLTGARQETFERTVGENHLGLEQPETVR